MQKNQIQNLILRQALNDASTPAERQKALKAATQHQDQPSKQKKPKYPSIW